MLEKLGLPAKPSMRGSAWVVDASHCQGCSSQFTLLNRKHHCRRCGGLFCGNCTQQRMTLRGQGDSPVRICEPCKKLEEAARFELRQGYKNRAVKAGSSKRTTKNPDDVLSEILGSDIDVSSSSESVSSTERITSKAMASSNASFSSVPDMARNSSKDMELDAMPATPEELRRQAVEEKNTYRVLKGEGKSEEALKAFKRGKELERQAEALEISLRKNRKRALSLKNVSETRNKAAAKEPKTQKPPRQNDKGKDDLVAELKELGWSDDEDKKPAHVSLEGEFTSLLREIPVRTNPKKSGGIDKSQVVALKKKALVLKREGKLAEAKEELKKAKVLERELEEQELLGGDDESDDELSALIHSMDDEKEDDLLDQYEGSHDIDFSNLVGTVDDIGVGEFDVTDDDMVDPEIAAALQSFGWTEAPEHRENVYPQPTPTNREERLAEIQSLKREALNLKRAGNVAEAMATLKKAKLLEKELETVDMSSQILDPVREERDMTLKPAPRSRLAIQRELLAVKRKALTLKREGKFAEAEEELKKGAVLQNQLEELDSSPKLAAPKSLGEKDYPGIEPGIEQPDISKNLLDDDGEVDVKDEELNDPTYLSMLKSLGWNEQDNNSAGSSSKSSDAVSSHPGEITKTPLAYEIHGTQPKRSKAEIQRELLVLNRKALALRRQGNTEEAEEIQNQIQILKAQMMEIDSGKNVHADGDRLKKQSTDRAINGADDSVTENDMMDPSKLSQNLGWVDDEHRKEAPFNSMQSSSPRIAAKSKGQIQRELLDLKKKARAFKIQGKTGEAEELYSKASVLEAELAKLEAPKTESVLEAYRAEQLETKSTALASNSKNYMDVDLLVGFQMEDKAVTSPSVSHAAQDNYDLLGDFNVSAEPKASSTQGITRSGALSQSGHQSSMMPLLTGDHQDSEHSLKQEILAHKRKALTLKREGRLSEAKEALQQAKLLEKRLKEDNPPLENLRRDDMVPAAPVLAQEEEKNSPSSSVPKVMSSRDRFKIQQQSLSHKRQAMKLRKEGKMQEAEAESEKAKALEAQLEDSTSSSKSEPVNDVAVEDFLDPQLLSALKAIGIDSPVNPTVPTNTPASVKPVQEPVKPIPTKESDDQERSQLEERIKAEKVKAVTLKRAGKQGEALDALRRAKLYEKKLNALASS